MTQLDLAAFAIDCPDPRELADFYGRLLGWQVDEEASNADWVELANPNGSAVLAFQRDPDYRPPTWPSGEVPQMMHLDIRVQTIAEGYKRAVGAGATPLPQPPDKQDAKFRVYADPVGHPFCMCAIDD
ncbi:Glyoxalase/Bleomycin resistance protein/Dioxygenase superfamily protein [Saccharopolyspora antimicrobica]|uniref:Glyoxalase/bleomycin resistance protein/dioxygenase superfamily protein n=1 Tax=Saccharopolyspora antimicrobica TaxID=455193 RepID=A0A1I4QDK3_9PSEU|nr:VOC family protein [Saccharopolyspora antimicrobica]RKT84888.1 glyoxalase/bleomycin resistance protein/dioxygenase superfamily protein [Saccharopolyspora antimicrobica]SFM38128.1 Glyoxalase/Bleomycin resistance protein/Dioxygenase superfamily protein [Saccharopolyspora antimicrobica]